MHRGTEMLGGVLVLRTIAATDVPTAQAFAQMHPCIADLEALFAAVRRSSDRLDGGEMRADGHYALALRGAGEARFSNTVAKPPAMPIATNIHVAAAECQSEMPSSESSVKALELVNAAASAPAM